MSKLEFKIRRINGEADKTDFKERFSPIVLRFSKIIMSLLAIISLVSMVIDFGFYLNKDVKFYTGQLPYLVLYGFSLHYLLTLYIQKEKRKYLKSHRIELALVLLIIIYIIFPKALSAIALSINPMLNPKSLTYIYLITTQMLALLALVIEGVKQSKKLINKKIQPAMLFVLSFFFLIAFGTVLLMMPKCTNTSIDFLDALFTSASAVTVTGLTVVDTETVFTYNGKLVILLLIQIGGLGIMTLTSFFAFFAGKSYNLKEYIAVQEILGEENLSGIKRLIYQIVLLTVFIEAIGALLIYFTSDLSFLDSSKQKIFFAIFHSVSAFCNAGFSLLTQNLAHQRLFLNFPFLLVIMSLIVLGGIGFPVLRDVRKVLLNNILKRNKNQFKLYTKIVLISTSVLIIGGTILFWLVESKTVLGKMNFGEQLLTSLFQSITTRTAGFNTIDFSLITPPAILIVLVLMWIGASPASTGGGIKTTAVSISILNLLAIARGKNRVEILKKRISERDISRAFSTIILSMIYISIASFILLLTEKSSLDKVLFEVISAVSTVGLTMGITQDLSPIGKIVISISMFIGRIGFLTFVLAIFKTKDIHIYDYVEEKIIL